MHKDCYKLLVNSHSSASVEFYDFFASVLIAFMKEWIFQGPYSTILEVLHLYCVNGICFGVIDSLPFETPPVLVRTT